MKIAVMEGSTFSQQPKCGQHVLCTCCLFMLVGDVSYGQNVCEFCEIGYPFPLMKVRVNSIKSEGHSEVTH